MSKVEEIHSAIEQLTLEERVELAALLADDFPDDGWDQQMKVAACTGKFDALNADADTVVREGRTVLLNPCPAK